MKSVFVAALLISGTAQAQPGNVAPLPSRQVDQVDEDVALGLSLGGTIVSWGLLIGSAYMDDNAEPAGTIGAIGTMFAPSFGHWYSHKAFTRGMGIRLLGVGVGLVGFGMAIDSAFDSNNNNDEAAGTVLLLAAGLYVAGTVDDIATATSTARAYNTRFQDVAILPSITQHGGGVSLTGRF